MPWRGLQRRRLLRHFFLSKWLPWLYLQGYVTGRNAGRCGMQECRKMWPVGMLGRKMWHAGRCKVWWWYKRYLGIEIKTESVISVLILAQMIICTTLIASLWPFVRSLKFCILANCYPVVLLTNVQYRPRYNLSESRKEISFESRLHLIRHQLANLACQHPDIS